MRNGNQAPGERGYALVFALLLTAAAAASAGIVVDSWSQQVRREKEADLLRVGLLYAKAIAAYRESSPGNQKQWPRELNALLEDARHLGVRRHLREAYPDPVNGRADWGLIRSADGGIQGVYSLSDAKPLRQLAWRQEGVTLPAAQRYSDWRFMMEERR